MKTRPRFKIICTIEPNEDDDNVPEEVNVHIDWGGPSKTPISSYPYDVLKKIAYHLFIRSPNIGDNVLSGSIIYGYREIKKDVNIFRSHPSYSNNNYWYDWAYFSWQGFQKNIAARIMMIVELSEYVITYDTDIDQYTTPSHSSVTPIRNLTKEKWVVILATEAPTVDSDELADYHYDSNITTRIKLYEDKDIWIVPLTSCFALCFVVYHNSYCDSNIEDNICTYVHTTGQLILLNK